MKELYCVQLFAQGTVEHQCFTVEHGSSMCVRYCSALSTQTN